MSPGGDDSSVKVAIRIRPQLAREQIEGSRICTFVTTGEPQITLGKDKQFTYDSVCDLDNSQEQVYAGTVKNLVEGCFDGFNATVIAYGQTGAGKTHTMGTGFELNTPSEQEGMIPRALRQIFNGVQSRQAQAIKEDSIKPEFFITVQFMEIYNEDIHDLFNPEGSDKIRIHEKEGAIVVDGLKAMDIKSFEETMRLLQTGALNRTTASTKMNTQSSRSHAVFTLNIKQTRAAPCHPDDKENAKKLDLETVSSKFHFVDLAGSERLKRTGATGDRAKEGISINQGLLALGNVISALGDASQKRKHVPYRDSKITRLLQDSLGGNSRTIMIACISPSDSDFMETLNTLKYANRARNIQNKITQNQDSSSKQLALLRTQLSQALSELALFKTNGVKPAINGAGDSSSSVDIAGYNDMFQENYLLQEEIKKLKEKIRELQDTVDRQKERLIAMQMENVDSKDEEGRKVVADYLAQIEDLKNRLTQAEIRNARPRIGSARETATLNTQKLIERAKYDIELRKAGNVLQTSSELSPRDSHEDEDVIDDDFDDQSPSDDEAAIEFGVNAEEQNNELSDITNEIDLKEQLVMQLEATMANLESQRKKYENQLSILEAKIQEAEKERDLVMAKQKSKSDKDPKSKEKIREMEQKLSLLRTDLKQLQQQKIENEKLSRREEAKSRELSDAKNKLQDMKRQKVDLIKKMRDEAKLFREKEMKNQKELHKLKKSMRLTETNAAAANMKQKSTEDKLQRSEKAVNELKLQLKNVKNAASKNGLPTKSPRNGLRQQPGNIRPQTRSVSRASFNKLWSHTQQKIRSAIAAKETQKDVENELEKLLAERKALEDDKSYQNDEHVEYISERIQEAQSQLVELADDEPIVDMENASRSQLIYLINQMVPFFVSANANVNQEKRQMTANYQKVQNELDSKESAFAMQKQLISHLMDKKTTKSEPLPTPRTTSKKKRTTTSLSSALGLTLTPSIETGDESTDRTPSPTSTISSNETVSSKDTSSSSKLSSRFGSVFSRSSSSKVSVEKSATGKFLPSHSPEENDNTVGLKCTHALVGHQKSIISIVASDEFLFTSGRDKLIKMWDLVDDKEVLQYQMPSAVELLAFDAKKRVLYTVDGGKISAWDTETGSEKPLKVITESKSIQFVEIDDCGRLWVAIDKTVKCYVNHSDTGLRCASPSEITALSVRTVSELEVAVAVGGRDNSTRIFRHSFELPADSISPKITLSPHLDTVTAIVQFPDFIVTGSRDNSLKLWSSNGELIKTFSMAHADWILSMKTVPGRDAFVSIARDGSLAIWSTSLEKIGHITAPDAVAVRSIGTSRTHVFTGSPVKKSAMSWLICF